MPANQLDTFMAAIRRLESGSYEGNYGAIGPHTGRLGRARGAYQIMEANWAGWAREAGLAGADWRNPQAQDAVARFKFLQYYQKYQDWGLVAIAWFAGPGRANEAQRRGVSSVSGVSDVTGTSVGKYVNLIVNSYMPEAQRLGYGTGELNEEDQRLAARAAGQAGMTVEEAQSAHAARTGQTLTIQNPYAPGVWDADSLLSQQLEQGLLGEGQPLSVEDLFRQDVKQRLRQMIDAMSSAIAGGQRQPLSSVDIGPLLGEETIDQITVDQEDR